MSNSKKWDSDYRKDNLQDVKLYKVNDSNLYSDIITIYHWRLRQCTGKSFITCVMDKPVCDVLQHQ